MWQQVVDIEGHDSPLLSELMTQTIYSGAVAGVSHAKPNFDALNAEDEVYVIAEPHHAFDALAVRLHHPVAGKLGYLPKESTIVFHDAFRNGFAVKGKVVSFNDEKYPKVGVQLWVEI